MGASQFCKKTISSVSRKFHVYYKRAFRLALRIYAHWDVPKKVTKILLPTPPTPFLMLLRIVYFCILVLIISLLFTNSATNAVEVTGIDFLGQATLPKGFSFQKTPMGGLSGITYDAKNQVYYVISDDRSERASARFYTLKIDLSKGSLKDSDVVPVGVTTLIDKSGHTFPFGTIDAEGIAKTSQETVFISSEGDADQFIHPFIREFSLSSGKELTTLPIPNKFLHTQKSQQGIRNNLAFEGLTITPENKYLYTATENALIQDGPEAKPSVSTIFLTMERQ